MSRYVALLRGINVGGANKVPMADLRKVAEELGWAQVRTYIASGNLVFDAPDDADHAAMLRTALQAAIGVDVPALVLSKARFAALLAACPFDPAEGKHVHGFLAFESLSLDAARYAALKTPSEELVLHDGVAWLHAPEGIGRSKLAEKLPQVLSGQMTGRNLNTLRQIAAMLGIEAAPPKGQ